MENISAYRCECCFHCLTLNPVLDDEDIADYGEYTVAIQSWDCAGSIKPNLWWRLKLAGKMLFKGDIHGDHVILKKRDLLRLAQDLINVVERIKEKEGE